MQDRSSQFLLFLNLKNCERAKSMDSFINLKLEDVVSVALSHFSVVVVGFELFFLKEPRLGNAGPPRMRIMLSLYDWKRN